MPKLIKKNFLSHISVLKFEYFPPYKLLTKNSTNLKIIFSFHICVRFFFILCP